MKLNLKSAVVLGIAGLLTSPSLAQDKSTIDGTTPFGSSSQYRTWSIGVNAGVLNQSNGFGVNRKGYNDLENNVGYSAYIKKQISPSFGLKAQYLGGKVGGKRDDGSNSFETKTPWSAALSGEFTLANTNFRFFNSLIKPYAAIGIGAMDFESTTTIGSVTTTHESKTKLFVPMDVGLKFAVAKGINLDLGYQLNWVNQDFDGTRIGTVKHDLFSYIHAGLEFSLGDPSKPALNNSNPVATLIGDYTAKYDELKAERDALAASNEALKSQVEQISNDLKDDDGDGVANKFDKCPGTPAGTPVDGSGCPIVLKNETKIVEKVVVTEADRKVVDEAIKNLEFDLGKSTIRSTSYPSLDRVAALLIEKNFSLKLAGHTDNTGSMQTNLRLSKERAEAVKSYLSSKGANPSRIEATGYGPNQPIATNATAEGRQENRRVEFTIY
ncbi:OmpA family protein [Sphingobacterium sp. SYP-B4668]|uniref:OmpA family protein n=1 Tax=Sphingobacterium sp. SYP-B4668 TaxID=2996035 RepID=UPI0022DDCC41|nr:OmpA family protein [Sphingobacterium sp. SYP-B4668]